jgi:hypothetical protein
MPRLDYSGVAISPSNDLLSWGTVMLIDARCLHQVRRHGPPHLLEVFGLDVGRASAVVGERLDEHVLVPVVDASGSVEPETAGLSAGRAGEVADHVHPAVSALGSHPEFGRNRDHL